MLWRRRGHIAIISAGLLMVMDEPPSWMDGIKLNVNKMTSNNNQNKYAALFQLHSNILYYNIKMCLSKLTQIIYGVLAVCIIAFILGSMFTPGWRKIRAEVQNGTDSGAIFNETITKGIFPFGCAISTDASGVHFNRTHAIEQCEQWWNNQPGYEKAVIALMVVALATSLLALAWNILTFFCCLGKGGIFRPLPSLAATTTICLLVAIIVFYANNKTDIEMVRKWKDVKKVDDFNDVSYSFYLAIAATVFAVVNVIVGSITVQAADKCL